MKIIYISDIKLDDSAVELVHIDALCKNLSKLENEVVLYVPKTRASFDGDKYLVKYVTTPRFAITVFFQIKLLFILTFSTLKNRPDIIYSRNSQFLFMAAFLSRIFHVPFILEANGQILDEARQTKQTLIGNALLKLGILRFIESFNVRAATKIIAVTEGVKSYYISRYNTEFNKVVVIRNGVDTSVFVPRDVGVVRAELGLDASTVYVCYIGSFYSWQGLKYIAEAAKKVIVSRSQVKFIIIGDGDDREYLENFIHNEKLEKSLILNKPIQHDLVPTYVSAMDICLCYPLKSRSGATSPFKVYEYLASGKPVVAANIGGMNEEFGDSLFYAEPESSSDLANAIISLVDDKEKRLLFGSRGRAFVQQGRSWEAVTKSILKVFEQQL